MEYIWMALAGGAAAFLACALYVPALRRVFHFSYLTPLDVAFCVMFGVASVVWFELSKIRRSGGTSRG